MTNGTAVPPRPDGEWVFDFSRFGATVSVRLGFIGKIAASVIAGGLSLYASPVEGQIDTPGAALLASALLPAGGTGGVLTGADADTVVANPGAACRYLVIASFAGLDGSSSPVPLDYEQSIMIDIADGRVS